MAVQIPVPTFSYKPSSILIQNRKRDATCREALFQYKFNDPIVPWQGVRDEKSWGKREKMDDRVAFTTPCQEPRGAAWQTRVYRGVFRARCTRVKLVQLYIRSDIR